MSVFTTLISGHCDSSTSQQQKWQCDNCSQICVGCYRCEDGVARCSMTAEQIALNLMVKPCYQTECLSCSGFVADWSSMNGVRVGWAQPVALTDSVFSPFRELTADNTSQVELTADQVTIVCCWPRSLSSICCIRPGLSHLYRRHGHDRC